MTFTFFSVVIPTYNRGQFLPSLLKKISEIKYPVNKYEVLIVDNNSTDNTRTVIKTFIEKNKKISIQYLWEKKQGRTFAMQTGIRHASSKMIISLDDDIDFKPNLLQQYHKMYLQYPEASIIGGSIKAVLESPNAAPSFVIPKEDRWMLGEIIYDVNHKKLVYPEALFAGNFSLNLKKINMNAFNSKLGLKKGKWYLYGEDVELCWRLLLEGKEVIYSKTLEVFNKIDTSRITWQYWLRRMYCAGKERRLTDTALLHFKQYNSYDRVQENSLSLKNFIAKPTKCNFLLVIGLFIFTCGYLSERNES